MLWLLDYYIIVRQCRTWALCPLTPQEVCGTDDKTYTNDCFLRKQTCLSGGLTKLKHRGPCGKFNCVSEEHSLLQSPQRNFNF